MKLSNGRWDGGNTFTVLVRSARHVVAYEKGVGINSMGGAYETRSPVEGEVDGEITIDFDALVRHWLGKAARSKGKRAGFGSGIVKVKATHIKREEG